MIACNKTKDTPSSQQPNENCIGHFNDNLLPVIKTKCAVSGCHNGNSNLVALNNYNNLKERADNGRLKDFVLDKGIMPPANASQLTEAEKNIFKCWLENGAPQD